MTSVPDIALLLFMVHYGKAAGQWSREYYGDGEWCGHLGPCRPETMGTSNRNVKEEAK